MGVDIGNSEDRMPDFFDAFHYGEKPSFVRGIFPFPQEQRPRPACQNLLFRYDNAILDEMDLPGLGDSRNKMRHPVHPARRAFGDNGLRASIAPGTKKCFGTTIAFRTE
jgi:hypothetical protein